MMESELKPCPECKHDAVELKCHCDVKHVECENCGYSGDMKWTEAEAIAVLNTRPGPSEADVERVAELQLAAFLAGRGSVTGMKHGTRTTRPTPTMDEFRNMARAAIAAMGGGDADR